jgi:hypothetical protein
LFLRGSQAPHVLGLVNHYLRWSLDCTIEEDNTWLQRKWIPCHRLKKTLRGPSWPPEPRSVLLSYSASSERQAKREPWDASTWQTPVVNDGRRMPWRPNRHKSQASPPGRHQSARLRITMSLWSVSYNSGVTSLSCSLHQLGCKQSEVTTNVIETTNVRVFFLLKMNVRVFFIRGSAWPCLGT